MLFIRNNEFNKIIIKKRKKNYKNIKKISKIYNLFLLFLLSCTFIYIVKTLDKRLFPYIVSITEKTMEKKLNDSVSKSVNNIIKEMELKSNDFYTKSQDDLGKVNYLSVNTVLISEICNKVSIDASENLNNKKEEKISVPIGVLLGIESLANFGPKYKVRILPIGDVLVDYRTSFKSVGINQVNFQVWLDVDSNIKVINPLQRAEIKLKRKISLVNTIITGEVPIAYFNMKNAKKN